MTERGCRSAGINPSVTACGGDSVSLRHKKGPRPDPTQWSGWGEENAREPWSNGALRLCDPFTGRSTMRGSDMPPACHSLPRRRFATLRGEPSTCASFCGAVCFFAAAPFHRSFVTSFLRMTYLADFGSLHNLPLPGARCLCNLKFDTSAKALLAEGSPTWKFLSRRRFPMTYCVWQW